MNKLTTLTSMTVLLATLSLPTMAEDSFTAVGILATQATCQLNSIETKVINIPGFKSRTACEKFLIPNAHTKDFLGTDGEICRINYNFDGLCVAMSDE